MRRVSLAPFIAMTICVGPMIWAAGPALALPAATLSQNRAAPIVQPVKDHGRHGPGHPGRWRHWRKHWSRNAPPYGFPERDAAQAPAIGYAPAAGYAPAPREALTAPVPGHGPSTGAPTAAISPPAQSTLGRSGEAPSDTARPSIQWVDPDRAAR